MDLIKLSLLFSISLFALRLLLKRYRRRQHLPPGPRGLPILGNILEVQAKRTKPLWITYCDWSRIYGDVFTFDVLGTRTIVLNSYKAITELLEHRNQNYSDRPHLPMAGDLMRGEWGLTLMRYSNSWRLHRRTLHQFFQPRTVPDYYDIQRERTASLIQKLLSSPKDFFQHVRMHSGGMVLEILYGYRIQDNEDPYIKLADKALRGFGEAGTHGSFLVDYIPMLKHVPSWFPGAGFKAKAEMWAQDGDRLKDMPWADLKRSIREGTAVPCFCTRNLEKFGMSPASTMEEVIKNCASVAFLAGTDTTVAVLLSFILAMVANPEVQARAQKELDEVIGSSRLPDFTDRDNLPYINAILSETLRWNPVLPLSINHRAVKDDIYDGYLIPAGSTIVPNAWAVLNDQSLYGPDTASFNPGRFMKREGIDLPPSPELIAFGFGRRICPGRYLAVNTIWLAMTHILANFTIAKEINDKGEEVDLVVQFASGAVSHPLPFNCRFVPRSAAPIFK